MIIVVNFKEEKNQDNVLPVSNVDMAIEKLFHTDVEGILLSDEVSEMDVERLKAIVNNFDNEILVYNKVVQEDEAIQEMNKQLQLQRLNQMSFIDTLSADNLKDQINVL